VRVQPVEKMAGSPELSLALECCAWSFSSVTHVGADGSLPDIDWSRFLRLVRFHRVEGLAWNYISSSDGSAPDAVRRALSEAAIRIAAQNLQTSAECRAIHEIFDAAQVPLLFLKGLTVGVLAYGNPALKDGIDIDLLIDPADLGKAADLLRGRGYRLIIPRQSPDDRVLHAWHRSSKESVWAKDSPPLMIDLHTRAADNRRLIPGIDVHSPRQWVDIGQGIRLTTFADDELFAYLAVHGASSAWFRLKWISDFAALLQGGSGDEFDRLYRRSQELGAGRAAGQALLLADRLFGVLQASSALRVELARDAATRRLYRAALRLLTGEPSEPTERFLGTMTIHWTQLLLLPGLGYKLSELLRQAGKLLDRRLA
jgi:Uncharacterised nucleotidyltransferase